MLDGDITVESEYGKGSKFTFWFRNNIHNPLVLPSYSFVAQNKESLLSLNTYTPIK
jgi:hypothetical protein